jgi:hypothetical protein
MSDDPNLVLGFWLCRGCIEQYRLPPSIALLDDPAFPAEVPAGELGQPICGACFEDWRAVHGEALVGPRYARFAGHTAE